MIFTDTPVARGGTNRGSANGFPQTMYCSGALHWALYYRPLTLASLLYRSLIVYWVVHHRFPIPCVSNSSTSPSFSLLDLLKCPPMTCLTSQVSNVVSTPISSQLQINSAW